MIRTLLAIRLKSLFSSMFKGSKLKKKRSPLILVLIGILAVYVIGCFFFLFGIMFYSLAEPFYAAGLGWFYFALTGIMAFLLCFIGSIFMTQSQIFDAKDNELLLSMPIKPSSILISRIAAILILNYFYAVLVLLPSAIVYFMLCPITAAAVVCFVLAALLLPFLALALSCLFGWLIALISSRMHNKNIMTTILSVLFLVAYFYVYSQAQRYINLLIQNGSTIAQAIKNAVYPAYLFGVASANGSAIDLALFALCALIPFVLVCFILSKTFLSIATANRGAAKIKYREKELHLATPKTALLKKEMLRFFKNPMYILNASMGSIFLLIGAVMLVVKKSVLIDALKQAGGTGISLPLLMIVGITFVCSMNLVSAPTISLDGKTLWLCRSLPVSGKDVLMSKVMLHFWVSYPAVLIASLTVIFTLSPTLVEALLLLLLPAAYTMLTALLGVVVNLHFPKFDWISEVHAIKQGASTIISMFGSFALILIPGLLYLLLLSKVLSANVFMLACTALFALLSLCMYSYIKRGGSRRFEKL